MHIAFISFEYPPETGSGGIGTYLKIVSNYLQNTNHGFIIFTATYLKEAFWESEHVYRIPASNWLEFDKNVVSFFSTIHSHKSFDIIEGTDFRGCGLSIKKAFPSIPLVVKLHTPLFIIDNLLYTPSSTISKLRFAIGSLARLKKPKLPGLPNKSDYTSEFEIINRADAIHSVGTPVESIMKEYGFSIQKNVERIPLPIEISDTVYQISPRNSHENAPVIGFIGRLELRKGILDLVEAISDILKLYPNSKFYFIGAASISPKANVDMAAYIKLKYKKYINNIVFTGHVNHDTVIEYLDKCDIFIFPSHFESFGIACCEAMAAAKVVIGSKSGGMAEIIEENLSGFLVEPRSPKSIAESVIKVLGDDTLRFSIGNNARNRIKNNYSPSIVIQKQIEAYQRVINSFNIS